MQRFVSRVLPSVIVAASLALMASSLPAAAQESVDATTTGSVARGPSGLPLPRFVSLKGSRVNLRIGPGRQYAVSWRYLKPGLPVEIIQEYDHWRKIRDSEGTEGWVFHSLLSGKRTAVAAPWLGTQDGTLIPVRTAPDGGGREVARLEPGVVGQVSECSGAWCRMDFRGDAHSVTGWVPQAQLWGVYPGESVED